VLERVAERLRSLIDYDVFTVFLWNDERRLLEPWMSVRGEQGEAAGVRGMALGEGISGTAASLRRAIRVPNVCLEPLYVACDSGVAVRSEMAVPLVVEDRLIGVLDLESAEFDAFSGEHEQLLQTIGSTLAIALANAEMVEALRDRQLRLDDDLRTARKVQRQLLPKATPWIRGVQVAVSNEPAQELGGDFYDFFQYGDGRIAVAIGDVAGKATSAALYAALTVGILRELASHARLSPAEMLSVLNDKLLELEVDRRFVAMAFAVLDAGTRKLTLASAGIPYPLLVRPRGEVRELEAHGVPLGQLRRAVYHELELEIAPADTVVFFTDGIEEARDREGRPFGSEGTMAAARRLADGCVGALADGLVEAVDAHSGGGEASDDRTAVVLRLCDGDCA
jgi:sigma-B regulation protein RsbU (phosphoserine phosphatase)